MLFSYPVACEPRVIMGNDAVTAVTSLCKSSKLSYEPLPRLNGFSTSRSFFRFFKKLATSKGSRIGEWLIVPFLDGSFRFFMDSLFGFLCL